MRHPKRDIGFIAAAAVVAIMGAASVAWACTTQAYVGQISPGSGIPGSRATVTGSQFNPGPVDIRWNSRTGPVMATANGPDFSVEITIPAAQPGTYSVVAVQQSGTVILGTAAVQFEVASAVTESGGYGSGAGGNTSSEGGTAATGVARGSGSAPTAGGGTDGKSTQGQFGSGGAAFPGEPSAAEAPSTPSAASSFGAAQRSDAPASRSTAAASSPEARSTSTGTASGSPAVQPVSPSAGTADEQDRTPLSPRVVAGDVWSGFGPGSSGTTGPSLADASAPSSGLPPVAVGGIVGAGLVAMLGGFAVAEVGRRRPVMAGANPRR